MINIIEEKEQLSYAVYSDNVLFAIFRFRIDAEDFVNQLESTTFH